MYKHFLGDHKQDETYSGQQHMIKKLLDRMFPGWEKTKERKKL